MVNFQQPQPSLGSVALGCQDANLSVLLPVLDLALPAGMWGAEMQCLWGLREWGLGLRGP